MYIRSFVYIVYTNLQICSAASSLKRVDLEISNLFLQVRR